MVVALPLFLWAIINQRFDFRKRAENEPVGECGVCNDNVDPPLVCADGLVCDYSGNNIALLPESGGTCVIKDDSGNIVSKCPAKCGERCDNNTPCADGLVCPEVIYPSPCIGEPPDCPLYAPPAPSRCVNPKCPDDVNCICTVIDPTEPLKTVLRFKLAGVNNNGAENALVEATIRVNTHEEELVVSKAIKYSEGGIYELVIPNSDIFGNYLSGENSYFLIKGPKHIRTKFCQPGQTTHCTGGGFFKLYPDRDNIFDLTGLPLEPGDLPEQDGVANLTDLNKVIVLFSKASSEITDADKIIADVNYDGYVNILDAAWVLKSFETRYDED